MRASPGSRKRRALTLYATPCGYASDGATWTAFAYSPRGTLLHYQGGDPLADARITAVHSTDLTLETDEGPRRLTLAERGR